MARKIVLCTVQFGDMPLEQLCAKAKEYGYDGLELACNDNHLNLDRLSPEYCKEILDTLAAHGLELHGISNHAVGQCVCDPIDFRHKTILPAHIWGDGDPEGVRQRAAEEMIKTGKAAAMLGTQTVIGFTGSPIWHMLYAFPPMNPDTISEGFKELEYFLESLPLSDNNAVFNLCCRLCTAYEAKAFRHGLIYGANLMHELFTKEDSY